MRIAKVPTTPSDLAQGVLDVIAAGGVDPAAIDVFVHGSTVVINAITERKGARTALVTTGGFRDVLEIGRGNRPDMYNLVSRKPPPFVPRRHRFEVRERVDRHGSVLVPLDLAGAEPIAAACERDGHRGDRGLPPALLRPPRARAAPRERLASGCPGSP